jgi:uncharacterized protein YbjT (DUF2867 family)
MKKVIIVGATGSLAYYVTEALKALDNVEITLFARNRKGLSTDNAAGCRVIEGDAMKYNDVQTAMVGQDIVYVNLAGNLEAMTKNIVKAMQEAGVKRIIAISSIGIYASPLKPVLIPYRKLADIIEATDLDYTILRPDWFTNGNEIDYVLTSKNEPETGTAISRKSIAAFVALLVQHPEQHVKENLGISRPTR